MNDISALENRIVAALERIRAGVDGLAAKEPASASAGAVSAILASRNGEDAEQLKAQLAEERTANAQLEERVAALKQRQDGKIAELEAMTEAQRQRYSELDAALQSLRQENAELRAVASEMRDALAAEVAEPELVNRAILAELEALKAAQLAERTEVDALLAELKPIVEGAQ